MFEMLININLEGQPHGTQVNKRAVLLLAADSSSDSRTQTGIPATVQHCYWMLLDHTVNYSTITSVKKTPITLQMAHRLY